MPISKLEAADRVTVMCSLRYMRLGVRASGVPFGEEAQVAQVSQVMHEIRRRRGALGEELAKVSQVAEAAQEA